MNKIRKTIPEHIKNYKTFLELNEKARKKAVRQEKLFCLKNGFDEKESYKQVNLYKENGDLACLTVDERERWYNK